MLTLAILIFLMPALTFPVLALFHKRLPRHGDFLATGVMGLALLFSIVIFLGKAFLRGDEFFYRWTFDWLPISGSKVLTGGVLLDGLTSVMLVVVTLVSFLVHLFSMKYMEDSHRSDGLDIRYGRYYASLLLFTTSMLGLVLADNLLFLFIFWELVGLSSYILIGHWYEKQSASNAAIKAFITTRIGDVGMLIGMLICYWKVGSLDYVQLFAAAGDINLFNAGSDFDWHTWAGIGLFLGAMGKSAQVPFHVWLPDAMEGPTPVSALIHAATMVVAGVYLVGRLFPLFTPDAFLFIAYVGAVTALFAASIATVQDDIKRVLAYSTLSQLGYMMLALGVGGYAAGLFHLTTHAFFKAGLFLGSGSVIYAMHHQQSMSKYGGLWKKLPVTGLTYLICVLAISGFPLLFSGFWSKDEILGAALAFSIDHPQHSFLAFSGFFTALLTAYYMFRQFFLTFTGKPRDQHAYDHARESPWQMTVPLAVLASLAIFSGYFPSWFENTMPPHETPAIVEVYAAYHESKGEPFELVTAGVTLVAHPEEIASELAGEAHAEEAGEEHAGEHGTGLANPHIMAMLLSVMIFPLGFFLAWAAFYEKPDGSTRIDPVRVKMAILPLHTALWNKCYFDEVYDVALVGGTKVMMHVLYAFDKYIVDGIVNLVGRLGKFSAFVTGIADNWIVDGAVNGLAALTSFSGDKLSYIQTGRARNYLLFVALGVIGLSIILVIVV